jgi:hypothetical protein
MLSIQTNERCFCQSAFCYHGRRNVAPVAVSWRSARWIGGEQAMHRLSGGCSFGCWVIYSSAVIPRLLSQMEGLGSMHNGDKSGEHD